MDYDEILETWRTQDETPFYGVNRDLLLVVVKQEHAELRRESGWDLWFVPVALWMAAVAMLAVFFGFVFVATMRGWVTPGVWDFAVTGIATGAMLAWPVVYWMTYRRQSELQSGERGFDDPLEEEIRCNLARIDFHLARYGRLAPALLMRAPFVVVAILFVWMIFRLHDGPSRFILIIVAFSMFSPVVWTGGGYIKKRLQEQKRRLNRLLALLNASE